MRPTVKLTPPTAQSTVKFLSEKKGQVLYACFDEWNKYLKRFDENTEDGFLFVAQPFPM